MTIVGVLQFLGLVNEFEGRRPGQREPSYVGIHDFAALSCAALVLGLVAIAFGTRGRWRQVLAGVATVAGAVGLVLSGSVAAAGGLAVAAAATVALRRAPRRADRPPRRRGLRRDGRDVPRRAGAARLRPRPVRALPRHPPARALDGDAGAELLAADAPDLHRPRASGSTTRSSAPASRPRRRSRACGSRTSPTRTGASRTPPTRRFPRSRTRGACRTSTSQALSDLGVVGLAVWLVAARRGRLAGAARRAPRRRRGSARSRVGLAARRGGGLDGARHRRRAAARRADVARRRLRRPLRLGGRA